MSYTNKFKNDTDRIMHRRYIRDVKQLKEKCEELNLKLLTYEEAVDSDICVLSKSDYEIGEQRTHLTEDNESYFLSPFEFNMFTESVD